MIASNGEEEIEYEYPPDTVVQSGDDLVLWSANYDDPREPNFPLEIIVCFWAIQI